MPRRSSTDLMTPRLVSPPAVVELPAPPEHLSGAMQDWWRQIVAEYLLEAHHLRLLECAADAWDRMAEARAQLLAEGLTLEGPHGRKAHPAIGIERDSRNAFMRSLRELDLDTEMPRPEPGWPRPPSLRSNRRL